MSADSSWIEPIPAPFQGSGDAVYPIFATDGGTVCFASSRPTYPPTRLWQSERAGEDWTDPVALDPPIYSGVNEWGSSFTGDGTLYFCSDRSGGGDIYRAVTAPDGTVTVELVGAPISTAYLEGAPFIAPDESYLIFESRRSGGLGLSDLYISFRQKGVWSTPRNLGPGIDTNQNEDGPFLSPDGKDLFFNRRRAPQIGEQSEIWWVDANALFHPEQSGANDPGSPLPGSSQLRIEPNPFVASSRVNLLPACAGRRLDQGVRRSGTRGEEPRQRVAGGRDSLDRPRDPPGGGQRGLLLPSRAR
jgi:hypothetical protein